MTTSFKRFLLSRLDMKKKSLRIEVQKNLVQGPRGANRIEIEVKLIELEFNL